MTSESAILKELAVIREQNRQLLDLLSHLAGLADGQSHFDIKLTVDQEAAMAMAQGKDLPSYLREKSKAAGRRNKNVA